MSKVEITRCDLCGVICTNKSQEINGKDYCRSCLQGAGLLAYGQMR